MVSSDLQTPSSGKLHPVQSQIAKTSPQPQWRWKRAGFCCGCARLPSLRWAEQCLTARKVGLGDGCGCRNVDMLFLCSPATFSRASQHSYDVPHLLLGSQCRPLSLLPWWCQCFGKGFGSFHGTSWVWFYSASAAVSVWDVAAGVCWALWCLCELFSPSSIRDSWCCETNYSKTCLETLICLEAFRGQQCRSREAGQWRCMQCALNKSTCLQNSQQGCLR